MVMSNIIDDFNFTKYKIAGGFYEKFKLNKFSKQHFLNKMFLLLVLAFSMSPQLPLFPPPIFTADDR